MKRRMLIWGLLICLLAASFSPVAAVEVDLEQDYLVLFKTSEVCEETVQSLEDMGAEILMEVPQIGLINVRSTDPRFIEKAQDFKTIEIAVEDIDIRAPEVAMEADQTFRSVEPREGEDVAADLYEQYQWDIKRVNNDGKAWDINSGDHSVVVGVIDTGVDVFHPDLKDNIVSAQAFFPGATEEDALRDSGTHGTHVAGSIAANGRVLGVGPDLGIAVYRTTNHQGRFHWAGVLSAITTAADDGVFAVNLSLGTYSIINNEQQRALHQTSTRAVQYAQRKGMIVVGANGNNAMDLGKKMYTVPGEGKQYPGPLFDTFTSIPWVISVSSTTNRDTLSYFSNYGRSNVDLGAPGGDLGPYWPNPEADQSLRDLEARCYSTIPVARGSYGWAMGTSMAAPKVAAAAALVKAEYPEMSAVRVKNLLAQTADSVDKNGASHEFGSGILNVYNALTR